MLALEVRHVTKQFGDHVAVSDVSLAVPTGAIYGFIGPNGSGKTTTIRMVMGIILPDQGAISVLGRSNVNVARDEIGYLPEERGLYKKMTVRRLLRYYGQLKGRQTSEIDPVVNRWLGQLQLTEWIDKRIDQLSKGMAQKVQFIAAIVARPKLLILDEPFSGLDPVNAESLRDAVLTLRREGATVVFSTHDMRTAETLCDRIFMIFKGRGVLDGSLEDIQREHGHDLIRIRTAAGRIALDGMSEIESLNDYGNYQDIRISGPANAFLTRLIARTDVRQFEIVRPSLADIFLNIARPADPSAAPATAERA
jgi:ABC-2 type transport system ATP-binding protein